MPIRQNIERIWEGIEKAACKINAASSAIRLVCVTKNIPVEKIVEAVSLGISEIGESRIQEADKKYDEVSQKRAGIKWHFIGHLQTNKVKNAVEIFDLLHSLDSVHLAREIDKQAKKINKIQDCLIEVKVSEEESKFGCLPEDIPHLIDGCFELKNIRICGLMAMSPFFDDPEFARPYFRRAKGIYEKFYSFFLSPSHIRGVYPDFFIGAHPRMQRSSTGFSQSFRTAPHVNSGATSTTPVLSMGMSNDYRIAVEEGSNLVRVGTAIFQD